MTQFLEWLKAWLAEFMPLIEKAMALVSEIA